MSVLYGMAMHLRTRAAASDQIWTAVFIGAVIRANVSVYCMAWPRIGGHAQW